MGTELQTLLMALQAGAQGQGQGTGANFYNNPAFGYGGPPTTGDQNPFLAFYQAMGQPAPATAPATGGQQTIPGVTGAIGGEKEHFPGSQIDLTKDPRDSPLERGPMFTVRNPYNLPDELNDLAVHPTAFGEGPVRYQARDYKERARLVAYGVPEGLITGGARGRPRRREGGGDAGSGNAGGEGGGPGW